MKNKEDLISIIIPVYNVEEYLERCLESIINQTYKNLEIIIVDDGSTDNSGNIADMYSKKDKRIKVVHKQNEGLGLTRNAGMRIAKGKYIAFIDSDDYIELDTYEKMHEELINKNVDAVLCNFKRLTHENKIKCNCNNLKDKTYSREEIEKYILPSICGSKKVNILLGSACCNLYKKDIIEKNKIIFFNERDYVSEDYIFNLMYFNNCKSVQTLEANFYTYCENKNSLTQIYNPKKREKYINLYNAMKKEVKFNKKQSIMALDTLYIEKMRFEIIQEVNLNPNKKQIRKNIKEICGNKKLREILKKYNGKFMTRKQKIFTILMKYRMIELLILAVKYNTKG